MLQTDLGAWLPYGTRFHTYAEVGTSTRGEGMKFKKSGVLVFLPIFLSRTVQFRPRRNVRASQVTVAHLGSWIRHSTFVLRSIPMCFEVFLMCLVLVFFRHGGIPMCFDVF